MYIAAEVFAWVCALLPKFVPKSGLLLEHELASNVDHLSADFVDFHAYVDWTDSYFDFNCLLQGLFLHSCTSKH